MEKVAAMIMIKLEPLLNQWIGDGGSFESLHRSLPEKVATFVRISSTAIVRDFRSFPHSNETVELTTVTPPQRVKIVTADNPRLRPATHPSPSVEVILAVMAGGDTVDTEGQARSLTCSPMVTALILWLG